MAEKMKAALSARKARKLRSTPAIFDGHVKPAN